VEELLDERESSLSPSLRSHSRRRDVLFVQGIHRHVLVGLLLSGRDQCLAAANRY
jgi:hypothetical protein